MCQSENEQDNPELRIVDALCAALASGNEKTAAETLQQLKELYPGPPAYAFETLVDLLIDNPAVRSLYPYRLKLVQRRVGTPPRDPIPEQARAFWIARQVRGAIPIGGKVDSAVHEVSKRVGLSKSTIYRLIDPFGIKDSN